MANQTKFSPEVRERVVRMVHECREHHPSLWKAVESIAPKIGCNPVTLLELAARCTVARLMKHLGIEGARRGKRVRTTELDASHPCPLDRVQRNFHAQRPNQLWVVDFTYVSTWQGWLYVAFVTDAFARRIVGWQTSASMTTDFVLDALEQALHARQPEPGMLTHHGDRGSQYLSLRYSQRLHEAGVVASVGSTGDAFDNALAETINGLYKTKVIKRLRPWQSRQQLDQLRKPALYKLQRPRRAFA